MINDRFSAKIRLFSRCKHFESQKSPLDAIFRHERSICLVPLKKSAAIRQRKPKFMRFHSSELILQRLCIVCLKFVTLPKTIARQSTYIMDATKNIYPVFDKMADRSAHEALLGQRGVMLWFTGLSGSGKTTLALALERELLQRGRLCRLLDGDNIRTGLNSNLGFSAEDRRENIRRIAEVGKLFVDTGIITIAAFISPTQAMRTMAEEIIGAEHFKEVYISTPLEVCEARDVKGLYARARRGEIPNFTGISAPFEAPQHPALSLDTSRLDFSTCLQRLLDLACPPTTGPDSGKNT